ncbi:ABC transporter permease [Corynebacterium casei]|uniref:ABC transporter permease n=1 Tax=Corynebacterium casei TaxID=160386 RepID=UPI003FD0D7D1
MSRQLRVSQILKRLDSEKELTKSNTVFVQDEDLQSVSQRPSLLEYIRLIWGRRQFIWEDARGKTSTNNRDMLLGRAWNILGPLLDAAMYGVVFGFLLKTSRGIENFIGYLVIGVIFFGFMSKSMTGAGGLVQANKSFIRSFLFPRASLVFSFSLRSFLQNILPAIVAVAFGLVLQWRTGFEWTLIAVVPLYVLIHIFGCGITLCVARITAFIPDFRAFFKVIVRAWFYSSGVFFSLDRLTTDSAIQDVLMLNPAFQFLKAVRDSVLYGSFPPLSQWIYLTLWSVGLFVLGMCFFWQAEERYINV